MSNEPDYMLTCDHLGCGVRYSHPYQERLRNTGAQGVWIARRWAAGDGWISDKATDRDLCPEHVNTDIAPVPSPERGE